MSDKAHLQAPYVRMAAEDAARNQFVRASSYLRLGGYVADEESLLPAIAGAATDAARIAATACVTTSTTQVTTYDSSETYAQAQDSGPPTSAEQAVAVTASDPVRPSGAGLLIYSDRDLLANVLGSGFVTYGGGLGTAVLGGDVELDVPRGQYSLNALNRVSLTAGTTANPADIVLTAYNTISQTSLGPSDSVTYGDSSSETHGNSHSVTYGNG